MASGGQCSWRQTPLRMWISSWKIPSTKIGSGRFRVDGISSPRVHEAINHEATNHEAAWVVQPRVPTGSSEFTRALELARRPPSSRRLPFTNPSPTISFLPPSQFAPPPAAVLSNSTPNPISVLGLGGAHASSATVVPTVATGVVSQPPLTTSPSAAVGWPLAVQKNSCSVGVGIHQDIGRADAADETLPRDCSTV